MGLFGVGLKTSIRLMMEGVLSWWNMQTRSLSSMFGKECSMVRLRFADLYLLEGLYKNFTIGVMIPVNKTEVIIMML